MTNHKGNILAFVATDFGAYCYHRLLHTFAWNMHAAHHEDQHDYVAMLAASTVSGGIAVLGSYACKLGYIPMVYWFSVTCMHPLLHSEFEHMPILNYVKKRHEKHHKNPSKNFGPYFPFFDLAFGTEDL